MKTKLSAAVILNLILFLLELAGTVWMMSGVSEGSGAVLTASRLQSFRYFTVDSNALMGIFALIALGVQIRCGRTGAELPGWYYVMKLTGTVGVSLTMLVTVCFLAPTMGEQWLSLFVGSNFLFHLVNPLLSILIFLGFERGGKISVTATLIGIIPVVLYALYYLINVLTHIENGQISHTYDWYGFLFLGIRTIPAGGLIICGGSWRIGLGLWRLNRG